MTPGRALIAFFLSLAVGLCAIGHAPETAPAQHPAAGAAEKTDPEASRAVKASHAYRVALRYVVRFYPRFLSYLQARQAEQFVPNRLAGPATMSPAYGEVVAINNDTLYASGFMDVRKEPVVLTIPETEANYSLMIADMFGNVIEVDIPKGTPGSWAFTSKDWRGDLPPGVKRIKIPVEFAFITLRADRYSVSGVNQVAAGELFRVQLRLSPLSSFEADPSSGHTVILPVEAFGTRFKLIADNGVQRSTTKFLKILKKAMHDETTPRQNKAGRKLIRRFDKAFKNADSQRPQARLRAGARDAHARIIDNYLSNTDKHNWISFEDIGEWGNNHLNRSGIAEYIQWGNNFETAAYFHTFSDKSGSPLNGGVPNPKGYTLKFTADQIPRTERFWSVTAYTPDSVELIPNSANKYLVASYTPGLVKAADGSITIYIAPEKPAGVPEANWLPVWDGPFNLMLRVYGPKGSVAKGKYTPPFVQPVIF